MAEGPINPDREQQRADNNASRRQSGLEPRPRDLKEEQEEEASAEAHSEEEREEKGRDKGEGHRGS